MSGLFEISFRMPKWRLTGKLTKKQASNISENHSRTQSLIWTLCEELCAIPITAQNYGESAVPGHSLASNQISQLALVFLNLGKYTCIDVVFKTNDLSGLLDERGGSE